MTRSRLIVVVLCCLFSACAVLAQDGPSPHPSFEYGHGYAQGQTDSIELRSLNSIVTQPLSPSYPINEDFALQLMAIHTGFTWDTFPAVAGVRSEFYGGTTDSIVGAGWILNPGRMWSDIQVGVNQGQPCNRLRNAFVSSQGQISPIAQWDYATRDGSRMQFDYNNSQVVGNACSQSEDRYFQHGSADNGPRRTYYFDIPTGAVTSVVDRWGNRIEYTYMTSSDFLAIASTATPGQYNFDRYRYRHPGTGEFATEIIKAPKMIKDSMGRTINFIYELLPGHSKFLLTGIEVDTPNGRGTYRLHYQSRTISEPPEGWPAWDEGPVTISMLVKVEMPAAAVGATPLSYNYDYNELGELVEIRYPSGARTTFGRGDVTVYGGIGGPDIYNRGVTSRTEHAIGGTPRTWEYEKTLYPAAHWDVTGTITDRERTIVSDPVGNETEYRFSWQGDFFGFLSTIRYYKGKAPRWSLTEPRYLSQYDTPYNGRLVRATSYYYTSIDNGPNPDIHPLRRVSRTTFYDDDLIPTTRYGHIPTSPGSWDSRSLNMEVRDQYLLEGGHAGWEESISNLNPNDWYAEFSVGAYYQDYWHPEWTAYNRIDDGPMIGWQKTVEAGNLVGDPRTITGNYEVAGHTSGFQPHRIVEQGGRRSRTDYPEWFTGTNPACVEDPGASIQRVGPDAPEYWQVPFSEYGQFCVGQEGDIFTKLERSNQASSYDPAGYGSVTGITYSGGDMTSPEATEYAESLTTAYGAIKTRTLGEFNWYDTDSDIGILGDVSASRDSAGFEVERTYDDIGRLTGRIPAQTSGLGIAELGTYSTYDGSTESYTDSAGNQVTHTYSCTVVQKRGTPDTPNYEVSTTYYDGYGRVLKEIANRPGALSGAQALRLRSFDAAGAMTCESNWTPYPQPPITCEQLGSRTTFDYTGLDGHHDPFNRPLKITRPDLAVTDFEYFGLNTKTIVRGINGDPGLSATTIVYRDYSNRVRIVDAPEGADAIHSYDHLGNLLNVRLVDQVQFNLNSLNTNRFAVTNVGGQERTFVYDALGNLRSATHPEHGQEGHGTTTYDEYDSRGNLRLMTDPAGSKFKYLFDQASHQTKVEVKPAGGSEYKSFSETIYENDPGSTTYGPYALGKARTEKSYASDGTILLSLREQVYGGLSGRVSQERQRIGDSWGTGPNDVAVTTMQYNDSGRLSTLVYPIVLSSTRIPTRLDHTYSHGFLVGISSNRQTSDPNVMGALVSNITYNAQGIPASIAYANGVVETLELDVSSRPARITFTKDTTELWSSGYYEYDGASNIIGIGTQAYEYDLLGRLMSSTTVSPINPYISYPQDYEYDIYGNMILRHGSAGQAGEQVFQMDAGNTNRVGVFNPALQNLAYEYNSLGALTNDGLHAFDWDESGRLSELLTVDSSMSLAEYSYDDRSYRLDRKTEGGHRRMLYVRNSSGQVLTEFAYPSSSIEPHWRKDYIYALGRHIAAVENKEPNQPSGITSVASAPGATPFATISWLAVSDQDLYGYDIWRRSNPANPNDYVLMTWQAPDAASPYSDSSVSDGTTYWYKLSAVDTGGTESAQSVPLRIMVGDQFNPPVPPSFNVQFVPQSKAQATWSQVTDTNNQSDILGYNLYRKVNQGSWSPTPRNGSVPISGSSYMDTGLFDCNTYHYRLEAVDAAGRKSAYTPVKSVTLNQSCGGGGASAEYKWPSGSGHRVIGQQGSEEVSYGLVYYHVDHLGTPRVITDTTGSVVARAAVFPFGEFAPSSTLGTNTHWLTGHERDSLSSTDFMLARHYQSASARFMSPDPLQTSRFLGGVDSRYVYGLDNPIAYVDPDGRDAESKICKALAGIATIGGMGLFPGGTMWNACEAERIEREEERREEVRKAMVSIYLCLTTMEEDVCNDAAEACDEHGEMLIGCRKVGQIVDALKCLRGLDGICPSPGWPHPLTKGGVLPGQTNLPR